MRRRLVEAEADVAALRQEMQGLRALLTRAQVEREGLTRGFQGSAVFFTVCF